MHRLWTVLRWVVFTGLPACLAYFADLGGFASQLDEAVNNIAPVLAAVVPFVAIMLGSAGIVIAVRYLGIVGRKGYVALVYGDVRTFAGLPNLLATCKMALVVLHDTPTSIFKQGEFVERYSRLRLQLDLLFDQLSKLGIWVPNLVNLDDPRERVLLISYLTTMEGLARGSDLDNARTITGEASD